MEHWSSCSYAVSKEVSVSYAFVVVRVAVASDAWGAASCAVYGAVGSF